MPSVHLVVRMASLRRNPPLARCSAPRPQERSHVACRRRNAAPSDAVRYVIVGLTTLMAVLLYLDRVCLPTVERYVKEDLRIDDDQFSWIIGPSSGPIPWARFRRAG